MFPALTQAEMDDHAERFKKDISLDGLPTLAKALARFELKPQAEAFTGRGQLELFRMLFDEEGPYHAARHMHVLKNGSGEDLAIEFMGLYNKVFGTTY